MREIKFRAWNKYKMLFYNHWFTLHEQNTLCFEEGNKPVYVDESDVDKPNRVILMEYTGLKDKNGVEIYEGDILINDWMGLVQVKNGITRIIDNEMYGSNQVSGFYLEKLEYEPSRFDGENYNGRHHFDIVSSAQVIGNIYENPELIKE